MTADKSITLLFLSLLVFSSSCSLPKIIVLKDPLTPEEHLNLGVAYEKNNELELAVKEYGLAATKLPRAYLYLGNLYFLQNDFEKAEEYFKKTLESEPENADACNNLAWLYYTEMKNLDAAEGLALRALELNPVKEDIYRDTLDKIRALKSTINASHP